MGKRREYLYVAGFFCVVLALWTALYLMPQPIQVNAPNAEMFGELASADFGGVIYRFGGVWESWPERLYAPAELYRGFPRQSDTVDYSGVQYITHRLRLALPDGVIYAITMTSADFSMRIFINGAEIDSVGEPGTTRETTVSRVLEKTYVFTPVDGTVEIVIQAANFVHSKAGCRPPVFYIGKHGDITRFVDAGTSMGFLVTGCLLAGFFYHLGLFCLNRKRKPELVFAISCLLLTIMSKKLYFLLFPAYDWFIGIRVEYAIHFLTFVTLTFFVETLHPRILHKPVTRVFYALAAVFLLTLFSDPRVFTGLLVWFEIASAFMILYILARLAAALRGGTMKNWLSFAGVLALGLLGLNDMLYYRGIIVIPPISGQFFLTPFGMVFFVFCYAIVLSIEHAETERAMRAAREAEQILAAENAALDRLNKMKTDLMATISHETRTPLAIMSNFAELVAMELRSKGLEEQTAADLDKISDEIIRIAGIMEEMQHLSLIKDNASRKEWVKPDDLINRIARLYAPIIERGGTRFDVELEDNVPPIFVNAGELTQVLVNLLQNARGHTENGRVRVGAKLSGELGETVVITVSDTGTGIPADFLPHAFDRRAHRDEGGTGLGLSICKEIVEAHGGVISIESKEGHGTTVRFTLPVLNKQMGEAR